MATKNDGYHIVAIILSKLWPLLFVAITV